MKFKIGKKQYIWKMKMWQVYALFVLGTLGFIACIELPAMVGTAWGL